MNSVITQEKTTTGCTTATDYTANEHKQTTQKAHYESAFTTKQSNVHTAVTQTHPFITVTSQAVH